MSPINCPRGTTSQYRYGRQGNHRVRYGGCARKGRFIKHGVREVKRR